MPSNGVPLGLAHKLWDHQRRAVAFALQHLRAKGQPSASLIRMPTGSGKTGVIATVALAVPPAGWTLVLTPWSNLCDQMIDDLKRSFWADPINWTLPVAPDLERLLPSNANQILARPEPRVVLVSTLSTLVTLLNQYPNSYQQLAQKLSQVIVDEGHYEPAVAWGQAVKRLRKPTLLLTATPYRNDLKLFRIASKNAFHFTHQEAEARGIIRRVDFRPIGVREPGDNAGELGAWCRAFAKYWKSRKVRALHPTPRAIVCCASKALVQRVTTLLRDDGIQALGLHERFAGSGRDWLRSDVPDPESVGFDVWVHQNKLTEGVDDHRFCVIALLSNVRNDRKLVQQVGRVLRPGSRMAGKRNAGSALVLFSDDLSCTRSWTNYRDFETDIDVTQPESYRRVLQTLLDKQPAAEYFGGRFRRRLDTSHTDLARQVLLRATTIVRRALPSFTLDELTDFISDFLLLEDRILLGQDERPFDITPSARLWVYTAIRNSSLLVDRSLYEIRLGATAVVQHGSFVFIADTEGTYPLEHLEQHTAKVGHKELARVFKGAMVPKEAGLTRPWPVSGVVRRSTISAENLSRTPAQLTDAVLVCDSVRATQTAGATGIQRRHYVGFPRGRVSEDLRSLDRDAFTITEFISWTDELASRLSSTGGGQVNLPRFRGRVDYAAGVRSS